MNFLIRICFVFVGFFVAVPLQGAVVLVDFNHSNDGVAVKTPDPAGNYWNTFTGTAQTISSTNPLSLIDTTNTATGITLQFAFGAGTSQGFAGNGAAPNDPGPGTGLLNQPFAYKDTIFTNSNGANLGIFITLNNLLPNTIYDFSVYGGRDSSSATGAFTLVSGLGSNLTGDTDLENQTLANFSITSNASGVIGFNYKDTTGAGGAAASLSAMSITAVPEPSSILLGLAGLSLVCFHRRLFAMK